MTYTGREVKDHRSLWGKIRGQEVGPEGQESPAKDSSGAHLLMRGKTIIAAARRSQKLPQEVIPVCGPRAVAPGAECPDTAIPCGRTVATSRSWTNPRSQARSSWSLPQGYPLSPEYWSGGRIPGPSCTDAPHSVTDPHTPKPKPSPE